MNRAALLASVLVCSTASAGVEIGGTAGLHVFSDTNALGVNVGPEADSQKNSSLFALRIAAYFGNMIGVELEGGFIPSEPRSITADVVNITYRAHLIAQFRAANPKSELIPFVLVGGGAMDIQDTTNALAIKKDRDGMVYVGAGLKYRAQSNWGLRFDARAIVVPSSEPDAEGSRTGGQTLDFEFLLGVYREFGRPTSGGKAVVVEDKKPVADEDPDKDTIVGAADTCPNEAEDMDGFKDDDGCPDLDNDEDGVNDDKDQCKGEAEDKDSFKDDDGCPELDNDEDGVPDSVDKCPEPETKNGFQDDDGCPDEIPVEVAKFTGAIQGVVFKPASVELAPASNKVLDQAFAVLDQFKMVKLEIGGHTDDIAPAKNSKYKDNLELSQGRADSVKAYLVKKGIDESRLTTKGYGSTVPAVEPSSLKGKALADARAKNRRVEFKLITDAAAAPAPAPTPAP